MSEETVKPTPEERRKKRLKALNKIVKAAGWKNWNEYQTAVIKGNIKIQDKPEE
jgi:hypothetical protein